MIRRCAVMMRVSVIGQIFTCSQKTGRNVRDSPSLRVGTVISPLGERVVAITENAITKDQCRIDTPILCRTSKLKSVVGRT